MPELPEVEVTRRGLLSHLPGRTVVGITCGSFPLRTPIPRQLLREHILGGTIRTVERRAKYLLVRMEDSAVMVVHLGMTGKIGVMARETGRHKHDHLVLELNDGKEMRLNDSRRFGALVVWPASEAPTQEQAFSAREGIEPFGPDFTAPTLRRLAKGRNTPIKTLLMNARVIAGIGNIYANELLFAAGIHPLTPAGQLTQDDWRRIAAEGRRILQQAIEAGGSTIADFLGASGHPGYFQVQFKVYNRKGQPCQSCGQPIVKTVLAGRATYCCPVCHPPPVSAPAATG